MLWIIKPQWVSFTKRSQRRAIFMYTMLLQYKIYGPNVAERQGQAQPQKYHKYRTVFLCNEWLLLTFRSTHRNDGCSENMTQIVLHLNFQTNIRETPPLNQSDDQTWPESCHRISRPVTNREMWGFSIPRRVLKCSRLPKEKRML